MQSEFSKKQYEKLFDSPEKKAHAFDEIAKKYYYSNFGSVSKADFDVLMFSLYIEQILEKNGDDFSAYSDYTLSKLLGITQARVSNLKVKKGLLYPYDKFDWRKSLSTVSENAIYEDGKIKLFIPDKNLYLEIKNAVETLGGFVEIQLTPNLLQIKPAFFLDLMLAIDESRPREEIRKDLEKVIRKNNKKIVINKKESIGKALLRQAPDCILNIIADCVPVFGEIARNIFQSLRNAIKD